MLVGEDFHTLDGKGRVVIPSKYRRELEPTCIVTKGKDRQLVIYTAEGFAKAGDEIESQTDTRIRRQQALVFFGGSDEQSLDKAGRILVSSELRSYAGLELGEEIALVGVRKGIEVWRRETYLEARAAAEQMYVSEEGGF